MDKSSILDTLDTLRALDAATSIDSASQVFLSAIQERGFERYLAGQFVSPLSAEAKDAFLNTNFPHEVIVGRLKDGQLLHDPIIQYGLRSRFAFTWETAYNYSSRYGQRLMQQARAFGMNFGVSIPMRRPGSPHGGISLAASFDNKCSFDMPEIELISMHFYSRLEALNPPWKYEPIRPLSPQETDVLQFAAMGKTYWETGKIMNISESAVKDAMTRARRKLNAVDKTHAISRAISLDRILP